MNSDFSLKAIWFCINSNASWTLAVEQWADI